MKEKFEYIERQFRDELDREESLHKKAQIYFSIGSLILTALLFKLKDINDLLNGLCNDLGPKILLFLSLILVFGSLFFIGWSIKIHNYERPSNERTLRKEARLNISTHSFYTHRIIDLVVAMERNKIVNDKRANKLKFSLILLLTGYLSALAFIITILV